MVRVKNILEDDVYGLWYVKKVIVHKGGQRYALIPNKEAFRTKEGAEYYAYLRTRRFVERGLGRKNNDTVKWRDAVKCVTTAAVVSAITAVAVQWFDSQDPVPSPL